MTVPIDPVYAIQNLKALYCAVADQSAPDPEGARALLASIFLPDVVADYGAGPIHGAEAACDYLCTAITGSSSWLLHMLHSPRIEIAGDTATGDWTVMVHLNRRATGKVDVLIGRYSDEFRLTPQGWRIARLGFASVG